MATNIRRALFIGLGGTGMTALLHTKKIIYDNYGEIPPMLGFLGIDTDGGSYNQWLEARDRTQIKLNNSEQMCISVNNPTASYSVGKNKRQYRWIAPGNENALTVLNRGAGQVRSNGRFAITQNATNVATRLQNKLNQITNAAIINNPQYALLNTATDVHVIFSLAGGTGSGTFINLAYLIQDVLKGCKVSGYAVMGEVFRSMFNGAAAQRVRSNSYGAIKDLDYLMSLTPNSAPVPFEWNGNVQNANSRPFNALYLIDNKNGNNDTYTAIDQISQMIALALVTSVGQLSDATASVADNVEKNIAQGSMDVEGKRAWVAGLGMSEICYDSEKIAQIYANKACIAVIDKMTQGNPNNPDRIANDWINANKIRENLGKNDVIDDFLSPQPGIPFSGIYDLTNPKAECDTYINDATGDNKDLNEKHNDLVKRIGAALKALIKQHIDNDGGVRLCQNILSTLKAQFTLCDQEMKSEIDILQHEQLPLTQSTLESSQKELENVMGTLFKLHKKEKSADVINDTNSVVICKREIKRREYARGFYSWCLTEVDNYIAALNKMQDNLQAVYTQSLNNIAAIRARIGKNSLFQYDLAIHVVNSVVCHSSDIVFNDFVKRQADGLWTFTGMTSAQVADSIWQYVSQLTKTQQYAQQTIDDVLKGLDTNTLKTICDVIIRKAQPLLPIDMRGYPANLQPSDEYYVGVADLASSILNNNNFFKNQVPEPGANVNIVPIGLKDRIIIFHQYCVVPAFAVSALNTFFPEYEHTEQYCPGTSHWDYQLFLRMSKEHFSIMPQNQASEQEQLQQWVQALLYKIISKDADGHYTIRSKKLGGRPIEGYRVRIGETRLTAYHKFTYDLPFIKDELIEQIDKLKKQDRTLTVRLSQQVKKEVTDGVYHLPGHLSLNDIPFEQLSSLYPEEYAQLDKEIGFIQNM